MPSPSILDFTALTAPIPGADPSGDSVPFSVRKRLDEMRKTVDPAMFAADDPMRPDQPKFADWDGIIDLAQETLKETSKDLLVVARLTEAMVKSHGFAGLRDSFRLYRMLIVECWDRLQPTIEDGDLEPRGAGLNWLDDADRGGRFPTTIRLVPMIVHGDDQFTWQDWRDAHDGKPRVNKEKLDQTVQAMTRAEIATPFEDLGEAREEIGKLVEALTERMGDLAPGMTEVNRALGDCLTLAQQILAKKGPAPVVAPVATSPVSGTNGTAVPQAAMPAQVAVVQHGVPTREQVYQQLAEVSSRLLEIDPHSPISYLVQRAVRLSRMSLPQLIRVLIRDEGSLSDLNRQLDLGIDADGGGNEESSE